MGRGCRTLALLAGAQLSRASGQEVPVAPCAHPVHVLAIARADQDIAFSSLGGPREEIPAPVKQKIDALASTECFHVRAFGIDSIPLERVYGKVFRVPSPNGLSLYAFERITWDAAIYFFMLFDSTTHRLTASPVGIYSQFASDDGRICARPFVSFEDLDRDGQPELVVRERAHNGSSYNACVRHYYRIGRDLSLFPLLAVEERSLQDVPTEDTWLLRRVSFVSRDSLILTTYLSIPSQPKRKVGELLLSKHPTPHLITTVYYVADTLMVTPESRWGLISDSPSQDHNFIFAGESVWY